MVKGGKRKRLRPRHSDFVFMLDGLQFDLSFIHLSLKYKLRRRLCRTMKVFSEKMFFE